MAMANAGRKERLSPPLMYAFRTAYEARDAKKKLDLRDESGERVIASRRTAARVAITEPTLRREVARDLDALMNTIAMESTQDLHEFGQRGKSCVLVRCNAAFNGSCDFGWDSRIDIANRCWFGFVSVELPE